MDSDSIRSEFRLASDGQKYAKIPTGFDRYGKSPTMSDRVFWTWDNAL